MTYRLIPAVGKHWHVWHDGKMVLPDGFRTKGLARSYGTHSSLIDAKQCYRDDCKVRTT